ncbi:hypothetical protein M407DRAFT_23792 [Tulasnella calospora MUT 4182]|uniref:F-box domain-containing protein n=1 Tax=Tulasnella calospora MUT 4182 TaxID=1051891 RepID=A0A0C3LZZ4_9AGAM|nr:hypothetical protein M407DRAFT_23792 [Tulasnella calospora MUT 4182]
MAGVTLLNCDPDEVKFLFGVLQDIKGILGDAGPRSTTKMMEMNAVKDVLNKALKIHRLSSDDAVTCESQNPSGSECDVGDLNHNKDAPGGEQWKFERLCKWILSQLQANGLEETEQCRGIIEKLEARCGLADQQPAKGIPHKARPCTTPLDDAPKGAHNPSPIFTLPDELLQHIFRLAALFHFWVRAPLVLSHVNSDFRSIVLNTPSLWTAIDESLPLKMRKLYIARARDVPLDVLTRLDYQDQESTGQDEDWLNFLGKKSSRIGQMTVAGDNPRGISEWGRHVKGVIFTSLTTLAICVMNDQCNIAACPKWASFPRLRDLWIRGYWCRGWVGRRDPFPPTLRCLRLSKVISVSVPVLLKALDGIRGLLSLAMEDFSLDLEEHYPPLTDGVTLAVLEKLEFRNVPVTDMISISLSVSTPNLSSLSLMSSGPSNRITNFLAPFTAEHPQISSLRLLGFNLELQELKVVLHNLASLTHLHVRASSLTDNDLAILKKGNLLPRFAQIKP